MKNKKIEIITIIALLVVIIVCVVFVILQKTEISSYKEDVDSYKEKVSTLEKQLENKQNEEAKYYDCSFTQTWRVVDKMDGYVAEVPEKSYVILDKFQSHNAYAHPILTNLKEDLEVDKYYEFTYQVKGTGIINDISDITRYITDESLEEVPDGVLRVKLSIKETNKQGLDQIQEDICK